MSGCTQCLDNFIETLRPVCSLKHTRTICVLQLFHGTFRVLEKRPVRYALLSQRTTHQASYKLTTLYFNFEPLKIIWPNEADGSCSLVATLTFRKLQSMVTSIEFLNRNIYDLPFMKRLTFQLGGKELPRIIYVFIRRCGHNFGNFETHYSIGVNSRCQFKIIMLTHEPKSICFVRYPHAPNIKTISALEE